MEKRQIKEKLNITVIDGQGNCSSDCERPYWVGDNAWENLIHNRCSKAIHSDAVYSTSH